MKFKIYILFIIGVFLAPILVLAKTPNDPYFAQWSFEDTGVYRAWDYTTGSKDVVVAIIDNGFDTFHPDLRDNLWVNKAEIPDNEVDDDNNGFIDDVYGWNFLDNNNNPRPNVDNLTDSQKTEGVFNHATIVAGIIGAKGNNNFDGSGINWDVRLMNLKVIGNEGIGDFGPLVKAIHYAVDNGANVINISMVGEGHEQELSDAVNYAYQHNVALVAAAGNNMADLNISTMFPVCADETFSKEELIGVSAMDQNHHLANFSNIGSKCVDMTAPGVAIQSTLRFSPTNGLIDSYSIAKSWSGTSFSAPFVSGAAALLKSINHSLTVDQIFTALFTTTHHTPSNDEVGYANLFGRGLLQIDKAVASISSNIPVTQPIAPIVTVPSVININNTNSVLKNTNIVLLSSKLGQKEVLQDGKPVDLSGDFVGVEDSYPFVDKNGQLENVTISTATDGKKNVSFYNDKLELLNKVNIDLTGNYDLAVGDLYNNGETEIFLASRAESTNYFYVYNTQAQLLKTYSKSSKHAGAMVDFHNGQIVVAYNDAYKTNVEILDSNFNLLNSFSTSNILAGQIMAYDLDGDNKDEYILSAKAGTSPMLRVFTNSGTESYSFRVYPTQYRFGFHFALGDYNGDGIFDFIFTPTENTTPMRVTSLNGNFVTELFPFAVGDYGNVFTFLRKN